MEVGHPFPGDLTMHSVAFWPGAWGIMMVLSFTYTRDFCCGPWDVLAEPALVRGMEKRTWPPAEVAAVEEAGKARRVGLLAAADVEATVFLAVVTEEVTA